jgi:hypothetical protein
MRRRPGLENLEARQLLSVASAAVEHPKHVAQLVRQHTSLAYNPAGVSAILSALDGGAGHEFVTLIKKEIPNPLSVIEQFATGKITEKAIPGFVAQVSKANPLYTGPGLDRMFLTEAGAIVLKHGVIELGAITRGPFYSNSATTTITFAINRGAGGSLGPAFASEGGVTPDALVTVTVGAYGASYSATIEDLTTGAIQTVSASDISVAGPTVRVLINPGQLPSEGFIPNHYQFSAWTTVVQYEGTTYAPGIASVGSFAPSNGTMDKVGVLANVKAPTF